MGPMRPKKWAKFLNQQGRLYNYLLKQIESTDVALHVQLIREYADHEEHWHRILHELSGTNNAMTWIANYDYQLQLMEQALSQVFEGYRKNAPRNADVETFKAHDKGLRSWRDLRTQFLQVQETFLELCEEKMGDHYPMFGVVLNNFVLKHRKKYYHKPDGTWSGDDEDSDADGDADSDDDDVNVDADAAMGGQQNIGSDEGVFNGDTDATMVGQEDLHSGESVFDGDADADAVMVDQEDTENGEGIFNGDADADADTDAPMVDQEDIDSGDDVFNDHAAMSGLEADVVDVDDMDADDEGEKEEQAIAEDRIRADMLEEDHGEDYYLPEDESSQEGDLEEEAVVEEVVEEERPTRLSRIRLIVRPRTSSSLERERLERERYNWQTQWTDHPSNSEGGPALVERSLGPRQKRPRDSSNLQDRETAIAPLERSLIPKQRKPRDSSNLQDRETTI